jgi:hypothetical protein
MFRQKTTHDCAAHWGIFLPAEWEDQYNRVPYFGTLYHASAFQCNTCTLVCSPNNNNTFYRNEKFSLASSQSMLKAVAMQNTAISEEALDVACTTVSDCRPFNMTTRNCQEWVKEVMEYLVRNGQIPNAVLNEMKQHGFKTLTERSISSWNMSWCLCC